MMSSKGILEISWVDIDSSTIESIFVHYSDKAKSMTVEFKNGHHYVYSNINIETICKIMLAQSVGKAFAAFVKDKFPYQRV